MSRSRTLQVAVLHPPEWRPESVDAHSTCIGMAPTLHLEDWGAIPPALRTPQGRRPDLLIVREQWFDPDHLDWPGRRRTLLDLRLATPPTVWLIGWHAPSEQALTAFDELRIRGAVPYPLDPDQLWLAAPAVLAGTLWFSREVLQALYLRALEAPQRPWKDSPALTPQEQAMLELMHRGLSPREIGRSLGLSQGRVQRYLHSAFDKRVHG